MSTLQAIPTQHGIDILNSELKNTVTKYRLIGALTHDAPSESLYSFYENTIETSYYDDNGVLTFILNLPIEQHFDEYLHQIHVLDSGNLSVIECSTPKVALPKGIGGMVTLKAAISGEAGQVIFKHSEFVTETELVEVHLSQYLTRNDWLKHMLFKGMPMSAVGPDPDPNIWLPAGRVELLRADYPTVFSIVSASAFFTDQATIDADPRVYAGHWGDGDGATTFTTDDWALMMNIKVAGGYGSAGSSKKDHIQNINGRFWAESPSPGVEGAFTSSELSTGQQASGGSTKLFQFDFNASNVARTDTYTDTMGLFLDHYRVIPKGVFSYA
ncbi:hypothetical protein [Vibrio coralliilyticus]|uniref:hypothetical protein n=1 Tax=Vibrio coralliilyticus TaxID=190893 RepID=UPI001561394F|nr:hypothetical protein [Vibrio coralliilyticus]NRF60913.1 hypothetical protein [Vibrio coralliilyticus]